MQPSTSLPAETRTLLENVRWGTYVELADQRRGSVPRMNYFEGALELMSPRRQHENIGRIIGRMIEVYSEVLGETALIRSFRKSL